MKTAAVCFCERLFLRKRDEDFEDEEEEEEQAPTTVQFCRSPATKIHQCWYTACKSDGLLKSQGFDGAVVDESDPCLTESDFVTSCDNGVLHDMTMSKFHGMT